MARDRSGLAVLLAGLMIWSAFECSAATDRWALLWWAAALVLSFTALVEAARVARILSTQTR